MQHNDAVINLIHKIIKRTQINEQIRKQLTNKRQGFEPTKRKDEPKFRKKRLNKSKESQAKFGKNCKVQEADKKKIKFNEVVNISNQ